MLSSNRVESGVVVASSGAVRRGKAPSLRSLLMDDYDPETDRFTLPEREVDRAAFVTHLKHEYPHVYYGLDKSDMHCVDAFGAEVRTSDAVTCLGEMYREDAEIRGLFLAWYGKQPLRVVS